MAGCHVVFTVGATSGIHPDAGAPAPVGGTFADFPVGMAANATAIMTYVAKRTTRRTRLPPPDSGDWGAVLNLLVDLAVWAFGYWSQHASFWDFMWIGPQDAPKLTPFGLAIEVGFALVSIATGLAGV